MGGASRGSAVPAVPAVPESRARAAASTEAGRVPRAGEGASSHPIPSRPKEHPLRWAGAGSPLRPGAGEFCSPEMVQDAKAER